MTQKEIFNKTIMYAIFILFTALTIYPLIWLFYSSFKPLIEIIKNSLALPKKPTFNNYIQAIKIGKLGLYMINSIIYTTVSTTLTIIFSMMTSFAFAKIENRATSFLYNLFLIGLLITIQAILIPLFIVETRAGLTDTYFGVIIAYIAINLPLAVYLGTEYIKKIPNSLIEAAQIEGATYWKIFTSIILPICRPVIVTILILTSFACWNEFILVFILTASDRTRSLPVGIYSFSGPLASEYGMQFAALVIGITPMIILYAIFHKQISKGFASGAIKG
ncbi:MAG TPA: carbohydrate ABC transporter permease [Candidatus Atribacteria bacterium]|nr:MAG: carbohydrate ABC transporter permease [Candidatus Nealsonbacteria bacterium]HDK28102.1 carbohydrate ABC transporter permease [Candidatus Atribacteria bacterium]